MQLIYEHAVEVLEKQIKRYLDYEKHRKRNGWKVRKEFGPRIQSLYFAAQLLRTQGPGREIRIPNKEVSIER